MEFDYNTCEFYITLDELITALLEVKEHCVDGRSKVFVRRGVVEHPSYIICVEYDSQNVIIAYE